MSDEAEKALRASIALGRELVSMTEIMGEALDQVIDLIPGGPDPEVVAVTVHRKEMCERAKRFYMGLSEHT